MGSGKNPFENVSWSKPFGDSSLGQAGGQLQKNIAAMGQDVSVSKPFGNSALGTLGTPARSNPNDPMYAGVNKPITSSPIASPMAANTNFNPVAPTNDTGAEDAFRNSYLSALKPQTAFTFNAQNPTFGGKK